MRARHLRIFFLVLLPVLPGCIAAAVAIGAAGAVGVISYDANEARRDFNRDLPATWAATVDAMRALGYGVPTHASHGATEGELESGDTWVRVERHSGGITRVRVRVGTFRTDDHKRKAKLILEEVENQLR